MGCGCSNEAAHAISSPTQHETIETHPEVGSPMISVQEHKLDLIGYAESDFDDITPLPSGRRKSIQLPSIQVLVVDSDDYSRQTMCQWLTSRGYRVIECKTGADCKDNLLNSSGAQSVANSSPTTPLGTYRPAGGLNNLDEPSPSPVLTSLQSSGPIFENIPERHNFKPSSLDNNAALKKPIPGIRLAVIDLLLSDMEGGELLDWIVGKQLGVRVILMNENESSQAAARFLRRGASDVLHKPISRAILFRSIRLLTESQQYRIHGQTYINRGNVYKEKLQKRVETGKMPRGFSISQVRPPNYAVWTYSPEEVNIVIIMMEGEEFTQLDKCLKNSKINYKVPESVEDAVEYARINGDSIDLMLVENEIFTAMSDVFSDDCLKDIPMVMIYEEDQSWHASSSKSSDLVLVKPLVADVVLNKIRTIVEHQHQLSWTEDLINKTNHYRKALARNYSVSHTSESKKSDV